VNLRSTSARGRARRVALVCLVLGVAPSCGGDDTTRVELALDFPAESAATRTGTVHLWVLKAKSEDAPSCNMLIVEDAMPYDVAFDRAFDDVFDYPPPEGEALAAPGIDNGTYVVYAEAVDLLGTAQLAGCQVAELDGGTATVTLILRQPGTNDCSDPTVENGDPCDDRDFCTVNDECRSGDCIRGQDRNCDALADECNSAACDPGVGCIADPFPDSTPCTSANLCEVNATCTSGRCEGVDKDCESELPVCYTGTCSQQTGSCSAIPLSGVDCDDEDPCTMDTSCTSGICGGGGPLDADGDGHAPISCGGDDCNDTTDQEDPDNLTEIGLCGDGFDNDCDGCNGTAGNDSDCGGTETGLCANGPGMDDDCDGCVNGADSDCGGTETLCSSGGDDDCDGCLNGQDVDCGGTEAGAECGNSLDDDCDGTADDGCP
jgi:hypothetical protein